MSGPAALDSAQALALRLAGQRLAAPAARGRAVEVCAAMCGAQAQVGTAARFSLGARVLGLTDAALVRALLTTRTLVKTWTVRGTLHVVPAADLPLYVAAFGAIRRKYALAWLKRTGFARAPVERLCEDIVEALADGPHTRKEIAARVGDAHGPRARKFLEHSWGGVFHLVVQEGRVCFGPSEGSRITFARVDRWLGQPLAVVATDVAETEMARRFVLAYGPATVRDFAYWAGLYAPEARRMWERVAGELRDVRVGGKPAWVHASVRLPSAASCVAPRAGQAPTVRLLPHFDAFLLGHKDKAHLLAAAHYKRVFKNAGWISPVVLVDGRIAGTWSLERGAKGHVARVAAFRPLAPAEREGVAEEGERLTGFLGEDVRIRYRPSKRTRAKVAWTTP